MAPGVQGWTKGQGVTEAVTRRKRRKRFLCLAVATEQWASFFPKSRFPSAKWWHPRLQELLILFLFKSFRKERGIQNDLFLKRPSYYNSKAIIKIETHCDLNLLIPTQVPKLLLLFLHELVTGVYTRWSTDMECGQRISPGTSRNWCVSESCTQLWWGLNVKKTLSVLRNPETEGK